MHNSGTLDGMNSEAITIRAPSNLGTGDYIFFDVWTPGGDAANPNDCRVQITTPGGDVYPPSFSGPNRNVWKKGQAGAGFNTDEGGLLAWNGGDQLGWSDDNPDE
jgi:hypothetical protein